MLAIRSLKLREDVSLSAECTLSLGRLLVTVTSDGSTSSLFSAFSGGLQATALSVASSLHVGSTDVIDELGTRITQAAADTRYLRLTNGAEVASDLVVSANLSVAGSLYIDGVDIAAAVDSRITQSAANALYLPLSGGTLSGGLRATELSTGSAVADQLELRDAQAIEPGNEHAVRAADVYSFVQAEPLVRHLAVANVQTLSAGATPTASFVSAAGGLYSLNLGIPAGVGSEISAQTIADGSVTNEAFQHLSGVSGNLQAQLNGKLTQPVADTLYYTFNTDLSVNGAVSVSGALVVGTTDVIQSLASKLEAVPLSTSATRIADGSVTNAAFQYIAGVTSNVQAQLDDKFAASGGAISGDTSVGGQLTVKGSSTGWRLGGSIGPAAAATGAGLMIDGLGSPTTQYTLAATSTGANVWLNASGVMRFMTGETEVARYESTYLQSSVSTRIAGQLSASGGATLSTLSVGEFTHALDSTWIANGSVTNATFQHLSGVTSNVQTQLDARLSQVPENTPATRIGDGSVTNAMFQHLSGTAANVQAQLNSRLTQSSADVRYLQTTGGVVDGDVSVSGTIFLGVVNITSALDAKLEDVPNNTPATRIADGSVDNSEFVQLQGVTAPIQTQLNSRPTLTAADVRYHRIGEDLSIQGAVSIAGALVVGTTDIGAALANKLEAVPANTSASLIANGSVDNATFQHLSGVSANIQQQLSSKLTQAVADTRYVAIGGDTVTGDLVVEGSLSTATLYVNTTDIAAALAQKLSEVPAGTSASLIADGSVNNATFQHLSGVSSNLQTQLAARLTAVPTNTSATLIADGSVSNSEFQYLNGVTSSLQPQLDAKLSQAGGDARYVQLVGGGDVDGVLSASELHGTTVTIATASTLVPTAGDVYDYVHGTFVEGPLSISTTAGGVLSSGALATAGALFAGINELGNVFVALSGGGNVTGDLSVSGSLFIDSLDVASAIALRLTESQGDTRYIQELSVGTVSTLSAGTAATATIVQDGSLRILNLGLPEGDTGGISLEEADLRYIQELSIGTVTTVPHGSPASATATLVDGVYILDLSLPEGESGGLSEAEADALYVALSGGSISGNVVVDADVSVAGEVAAASLSAGSAQCDSLVAASISIGTLTSRISLPSSLTPIAIGNAAGLSQQDTSIAIGNETAGSQSLGAVAIGWRAGRFNQSSYSVAIGNQAARETQAINCVAVGNLAGEVNQEQDGVAMGFFAGARYQAAGAIAIGRQAGNISQGGGSVAIGTFSGLTAQGTQAVAVGAQSGFASQGAYAVAVGRFSGQNGQANYAVAIGATAGQLSQGSYSIAIGNAAAVNSQHARTIVLNATGSTLDSIQTDAFYVKPVRGASAARVLCYDLSTGEITHSTSAGDLTISSIVTTGAVTVGGTLSAAALDSLDARVDALEADTYLSTSGVGALDGSLSVSGPVTAAALIIGTSDVATSLAAKLEAVPSNTSATLIADGSVTNGMFQHLSGATSNVQNQLVDRYSKAQSDARYLLQTGGLVSGDLDVSGDLSVSNAVIIGTTNVLNALSTKLEAVPPSTSATLIADGSVSNTEFQFLDGVTGPIQAQLASKLTQTGGDARYVQLTGGTVTGDITINGHLSLANELFVGTTNILDELDLKLETVPANISVQQLANGSVDNSTFQHLSGVSGNIQLQLAQKLTQTSADARYLRTIGGDLTGDLRVAGDISVSTALFVGSLNIVNEIAGKLDDTQLSASRIGNGSVSNATYEHLSGTTSNIQLQLDGKLDGQGGSISGDLSISGDATIAGGAVSATLSTGALSTPSTTTSTLSASTAHFASTVSASNMAVGAGSFLTVNVGKLSVGGLANDTALDAEWIANGSVDNATFQHLSGVSSNVQGQLGALSVQVTTISDALDAYSGDANIHFDMRSITLNSEVLLSTSSLPDKTNATEDVVQALHIFNSVALQPATQVGVTDVYRYTAQRIHGAKTGHYVETVMQSRGLSASAAMDHMWVEPDTDATATYHIGSYDYLGSFGKANKRWENVHIAATGTVHISGPLNVRTSAFEDNGTLRTGNVELLVLQSVSGSNTNAVSGKDVHTWYEAQPVVRSLEIGSVSALAPGASPSATLSVTDSSYALHIGVPVGALVQASISVGVGVYGTLSAASGVLQTLSVGTIYGALTEVPANTDAAKIGNGSVSNTEYQYLDGVTEALQTQLDRKLEASVSGTLSVSEALTSATLSTSAAIADQLSCSGRITATELSIGSVLSSLNAAWIADGSVSNTRFQYLANLSTDVQQQLDALSAADSLFLPLTGGDVSGGVSVSGRATLATLSIGTVVSPINAAWIGDGSVSTTEFGQLRNVVADVQAQFDALSAADTFKLDTSGGDVKGTLSISGAVTMQSTLSIAGKLRVGGTGMSVGAEIEGYLDVGLGANKLRIGEPVGYNWSGNFDQVGIKSTLYDTFLFSMHEATGRTFVNSPDWLTLAAADVTMIDMTTAGDIRFYRPLDVQSTVTFREAVTSQKWVVLSTSGALATSGDNSYRAVHGKGVFDYATSTFLPLSGGALSGGLSVAHLTVSSALSAAVVRTSSTPVVGDSDIVPTAGDVYTYAHSTFVTAPLSISSTAGGVEGSGALVTAGAVWSGFNALQYLPLSGGAIGGALSVAGPLYVANTNVLSELSQKLETVPDATLIADGSVTNTAFQYIANLTGDAQAQLDAFGVTDARNTPGMTLYIPSTLAAPNRTVTMSLRVHTGESNVYLMGYSFAFMWHPARCTLNNITVGSESAPWDGVTMTFHQPGGGGQSVDAPLYRTYTVGSGFTTYSTVTAGTAETFYTFPAVRATVAQSTEDSGTTTWNTPGLPSYHFNRARGNQLVATFDFSMKDDWVGIADCIRGVWTKNFVDQNGTNYDADVPHPTSAEYVFSSFPTPSVDYKVPIRDAAYAGEAVFTGVLQNGLQNQNSLVYNDRVVTPALYCGALSVSGNVSVGGQLQVSGALLVGATNIVTELSGKQPAGSYLTAIPSAISVQNLANGSVDNSTFQHLSGVSSNLQTQLTNVRAVTDLISAGTHPNYYTQTQLDASFALVDDELAEKHPLTGVTKSFTVAATPLHTVASYSTVQSSSTITINLNNVADPAILLTDGASFVFNNPTAVSGYSSFELAGRHVIASVVSFDDGGLRRVSSLTFTASTAASATATVSSVGTISAVQYTNTTNLASQLAISNHVATQVQKTCTRSEAYATFVSKLAVEDTVLSIADDRYLALSAASDTVTSVGNALYWSASNVSSALSTSAVTLGSTNIVTTSASTTVALAITTGSPAGYVAVGSVFTLSGLTADVRGIPVGELNGLHIVRAVITDPTPSITGLEFEVLTPATSTDASAVSATMVFERWEEPGVVPTTRALELRLGESLATSLPLVDFTITHISTTSGSPELLVQSDEASDMTGSLYVGCRVLLSGFEDHVNGISFSSINGSHIVTALPSGSPLYDFYIAVSTSATSSGEVLTSGTAQVLQPAVRSRTASANGVYDFVLSTLGLASTPVSQVESPVYLGGGDAHVLLEKGDLPWTRNKHEDDLETATGTIGTLKVSGGLELYLSAASDPGNNTYRMYDVLRVTDARSGTNDNLYHARMRVKKSGEYPTRIHPSDEVLLDLENARVLLSGTSSIIVQGYVSVATIFTDRIEFPQQTVALGFETASVGTQGTRATAVGYRAGEEDQGEYAVALGAQAGLAGQGSHAVALGRMAGLSDQGNDAIAIGAYAATTNQHANSIVLNASGLSIQTAASNATYVTPLRNVEGTSIVQYNNASKELTYSNILTDISSSSLSVGTVTIGTSLSAAEDVFCTSYKSFGNDPADSNSTKGVIFDMGTTSNYYDFGTNGNVPRARPAFRLAQYHEPTLTNHYIEYQVGGSSSGSGQVWYDLVPSTDNVFLLHGYKNHNGTYSTSNRTYKGIWWFAQECRLFANITRAEGDMFKNGSTVVTSDSRVKKNIEDANSSQAYDVVSSISMKEYDHNDPNIPHTPWGFVAQNIETVYPGAVITDTGKFDSFGRSVIPTDTSPAQIAFEDKKMVNKDRLFQLLFSAFQHAQSRIAALEATVAQLTAT